MIRLRHYNRIGGFWNIPDDDIEGLFRRMRDEGKDRWAFPGEDEPDSPERFRAVFQTGLDSLYLIERDSGELMGFMWLNRFEHRLARIHFCSFDGFSIAEKIEAAETASDYILWLKDGEGFLFDVLEGRIAESNRAAQMLVSAAGFVKAGIIPFGMYNRIKKKSEPAVIFYKNRVN